MADTHEEQLLSELLSSIARDDERLEAAHLESRLMATLDASHPPRFRPSMTHVVIAAAVLIAVLVPGVARVVRDVPTAVGEVRVEPPQQTAVDTPAASATPYTHEQPTTRPGLSRRTPRVAPAPAARTAFSNPPIAQSPVAHSSIAQSAVVFVPLMAMTEQELKGSFQLVRVQMPRASLGALRSPLDHPNELVEADVLLGEDGMARAIRVSTSGSIYPWRSR
jgi:hypothetical protein